MSKKERRTLALQAYLAELKAQGVPRRHVAVVCVSCGTVQSMQSLLAAGAGKTEDEVERYFGFSCVGRFTGDEGCDWTLGGLFRIHTLTVVTEDGKEHPQFEPATPAQAKTLLARWGEEVIGAAGTP